MIDPTYPVYSSPGIAIGNALTGERQDVLGLFMQLLSGQLEMLGARAQPAQPEVAVSHPSPRARQYQVEEPEVASVQLIAVPVSARPILQSAIQDTAQATPAEGHPLAAGDLPASASPLHTRPLPGAEAAFPSWTPPADGAGVMERKEMSDTGKDLPPSPAMPGPADTASPDPAGVPLLPDTRVALADRPYAPAPTPDERASLPAAAPEPALARMHPADAQSLISSGTDFVARTPFRVPTADASLPPAPGTDPEQPASGPGKELLSPWMLGSLRCPALIPQAPVAGVGGPADSAATPNAGNPPLGAAGMPESPRPVMEVSASVSALAVPRGAEAVSPNPVGVPQIPEEGLALADAPGESAPIIDEQAPLPMAASAPTPDRLHTTDASLPPAPRADPGVVPLVGSRTDMNGQASTFVFGPTQPTSASAALSVPVGHPAWDKALGEQVMGQVQQNVQQAELHLDPPDLGSLDIRVSILEDQANVTFASPHACVCEALESAIPRLRQLFADAGFSLLNVSISQDSNPQQHQGQGSQPLPRIYPRGERQASEPCGGETGPAQERIGQARVDYYV